MRLSPFLLLALFPVGLMASYESPNYRVVSAEGAFEIRDYPSLTIVSAPMPHRGQDGAFMKAFTDKGRLSPLLVNMPVRVILESRTALMGAAAYAEARATELSGISPRAASVKI